MFLIVQQTEYFSTGDVRRKKDRQEAQTAAHVKLDADIFGGIKWLKVKNPSRPRLCFSAGKVHSV